MGKDIEHINTLLKNIEKQMDSIKIPKQYLESLAAYRQIKSPNPNEISRLGQALGAFGDINKRLDSISAAFVKQGIIKNQEALAAAIKTNLYLPKVSFDAQLKIADSIASMQTILVKNADLLKNISFPHISLYRDMLESIDANAYRELKGVAAEESNDTESHVEEDDELNIIHPNFFDAAVKINVYISVTDNHIQSNPNVNEEEKKLWNKIILPVLVFLQQIFMTWALGNTPITDMQIVKQFEHVVKVIEEYQYPIETTGLVIKNGEER